MLILGICLIIHDVPMVCICIVTVRALHIFTHNVCESCAYLKEYRKSCFYLTLFLFACTCVIQLLNSLEPPKEKTLRSFEDIWNRAVLKEFQKWLPVTIQSILITLSLSEISIK